MANQDVLVSGKYYHIYNRGINGEDLFRNERDYEHFLFLYSKFIEPIAETYSWVLMPNHFHLLVRIKENVVYKYSRVDFPNDEDFNAVKWETVPIQKEIATDNAKSPEAYLHFSHLFNAYAKNHNIVSNRHGNIFERPFKRREIDNEVYLKNVVIYIHNNPVHHGFCDHPMEYPWSSYL
ncbi:MAG: hypothetical protein Q8909_12525, partial [Bacteroidota bacterium]|nr:hypothetical protein [Bacteroidota bacterium]